ncbi:hypothetical protein PG299_02700 [Riemerella anatipestifer]|nr:hypothetical protein [Riemerella anatipestifer]
MQKIDPIIISKLKPQDDEILDLDKYLVDPDIEVEEPSPILYYSNGVESYSIFTEDNISMIQGRAKSRKSTLIRAIGIAIARGDYQLLKSSYDRNKLAIFDTEQGRYHCWRAANMIKRMGGHVKYYKISELSPKQKKLIVELHLRNNEDCGFVILDNIVHFLSDFNSAIESSELNQWLIKLKSQYNTHINLVLHENGNNINGKAKGHIGTLLENTCETIIRVEKDKDDKTRSIVSAKEMRDLEFPAFILERDGQGVPYLSPYTTQAETSKSRL